jgi:hypothetical protein
MFIYVCMALDVVVDKVLSMSDIHAWHHDDGQMSREHSTTR